MFDRWFGRIANLAALWVLIPAGVIGVIAGLFSRSAAGISAYGPFGWLMSGIVAFLLVGLAFFAGAVAYERIAVAWERRRVARGTDNINPVEHEFMRRRIRITDLAHPTQRDIRNKRFTDCELVGPATIASDGCTIVHTGFVNCDIVVVRPDAMFQTAIVLRHCTITGGQLIGLTVYVSPQDFPRFQAMGAHAITFEGP